MKDWFARYGVWMALLAAAAACYPLFGKGFESITLYVEAGRCILRDQPLLDCAPAFPYPPALAALMVPFAFIPEGLHKPLWYVVCFGSVVVTLGLSEAMAKRLYPAIADPKNLLWLRAATVVLCARHITDALDYEAYELPALALVTIGIWALTIGREKLGGFGLAAAAAIRATPLIFLPYLILKGRFRAGHFFLLGLLALTFLPDLLGLIAGGRSDHFIAWIHQVAGPALTPGGASDYRFWHTWMDPNLNNQSLRGLVGQFADGPIFGLNPSQLLLAANGMFLLVLAAILLISPNRKEYAAIDGAVLLIANLVLSPMTSRYHFVLVVPAYVLVAAAVIGDRRMRVLGTIVLAGSFMLLTGTSSDYSGDWLSILAYTYRFMLEGTVLLFVAFALMLRLWQPPGIDTAIDGRAAAG